MEDDKQKLIDMCFSIGIVMSDPRNDFIIMTREEKGKYIADQLRGIGFDTNPCGMSWGVLKK